MKSKTLWNSNENLVLYRCPQTFSDATVPVSNCRETEQQGVEKGHQFLLELLPDSSPDVICLLSRLRLRQNQQVQQRVWTLKSEVGRKHVYSLTGDGWFPRTSRLLMGSWVTQSYTHVPCRQLGASLHPRAALHSEVLRVSSQQRESISIQKTEESTEKHSNQNRPPTINHTSRRLRVLADWHTLLLHV